MFWRRHPNILDSRLPKQWEKLQKTKSAFEGNWALNQRMIKSPSTPWWPAAVDACMYVPLSINFYASLCFSAHLYAYLFSSVRIFAYLWIHVNVHIWHLCGCVSACACSYLWISERISAYLCVSVCIRVYPCVCACLHCVCKSLSNWRSER